MQHQYISAGAAEIIGRLIGQHEGSSGASYQKAMLVRTRGNDGVRVSLVVEEEGGAVVITLPPELIYGPAKTEQPDAGEA